MVRRFRREARAAARLRGPHAVRVHRGSGELPSGALFIAMELVAGESISQRLIGAPGWIRDVRGVWSCWRSSRPRVWPRRTRRAWSTGISSRTTC
jgi:serine/threonine protein kinase